MSMNRDNFRANQPPSKVLHIRNLPPDATEQDIIDLCKPFGRIVKTKLHVGSAKTQANQAFVEFENVNCTINMIYSFVGSADPPKVRSKTVYLQYSTRQEIGSGNWGFGGGGSGSDHHTGNVVLVIMDNIQVSLGPTLDTVHMLCAAFGEVAKIAMFEKASGLQALVQFKDGRHAKEAQQTLDGTSIPEHLVPNHPGKIMMKVSFSAHSDLQIRAQTDRSRDFTVPYHADAASGQGHTGMPAAAAAGAAAVDQYQQHMPISSSNVLLCMIDDVAYTPTVEALHTIFSTYGYVQKITIFEKSGNWQALVQYPDDGTAAMAKQYLDGHTMYPGGKNKLKMEFSTHRDLQVWANNDRNWDFRMAPGGPAAAKAAAEAAKAQAAAAAKAAANSAAKHAAGAAAATAAAAGGGSAGGNTSGTTAPASHASKAEAAGSKQQDSAGGAAGGGGSSSWQQHDQDAPPSGTDWEHAHNEATRLAIEALGDSLTGLPAHSSGPRTMVPHPPRGTRAPQSYAAAGPYGALPHGYGPPVDAYAAAGYGGYVQPPPAGYGAPPAYGYGPGYGY